jgi:hypothetical protein
MARRAREEGSGTGELPVLCVMVKTAFPETYLPGVVSCEEKKYPVPWLG